MDWDELEKKAAADDRNDAQERKRKVLCFEYFEGALLDLVEQLRRAH